MISAIKSSESVAHSRVSNPIYIELPINDPVHSSFFYFKKIQYLRYRIIEMKKSSVRDSLPLGFVEQQLTKGALENLEDFTLRIQRHLVQQLDEIQQAALKEEIPVIRPLAKSIQMGMHVLNDHVADGVLEKIQMLCGKMQSLHEIEESIVQLQQCTQHLRTAISSEILSKEKRSF